MKLLIGLCLCAFAWAQFFPFPGPGNPVTGGGASISVIESQSATVAAGITWVTPAHSGEIIILESMQGRSGSTFGTPSLTGTADTFTQDCQTTTNGIAGNWTSTLWHVIVTGDVTAVNVSLGTGQSSLYTRNIAVHAKYTGGSFTGLDVCTPMSSSSTGGTFTSGNITPTAARREVLFGWLFDGGTANCTYAADAPWATLSTSMDTNGDIHDWSTRLVTSTTGSYAFSGTCTGGTEAAYPAVASFY